MRKAWSMFAMAGFVAACLSSDAAAQSSPSSGDARILMALPDSLIMCEGETRFSRIEVAWNSNDTGPSDEPPDVRWSSSADSVASVKSNTEITARKAGTTQIIATVYWGPYRASKQFPLTVLAGRLKKASSPTQYRPVCGE
jgi:hypothetical protein